MAHNLCENHCAASFLTPGAGCTFVAFRRAGLPGRGGNEIRGIGEPRRPQFRVISGAFLVRRELTALLPPPVIFLNFNYRGVSSITGTSFSVLYIIHRVLYVEKACRSSNSAAFYEAVRCSNPRIASTYIYRVCSMMLFAPDSFCSLQGESSRSSPLSFLHSGFNLAWVRVRIEKAMSTS